MMTESQRFRSAGADSRTTVGASRGCSGVLPGRAPGISGRVGKLSERHGGIPKKKKKIQLRIGQMNVGSMRRRSAEVVETVGRRRLDVCLL